MTQRAATILLYLLAGSAVLTNAGLIWLLARQPQTSVSFPIPLRGKQ